MKVTERECLMMPGYYWSISAKWKFFWVQSQITYVQAVFRREKDAKRLVEIDGWAWILFENIGDLFINESTDLDFCFIALGVSWQSGPALIPVDKIDFDDLPVIRLSIKQWKMRCVFREIMSVIRKCPILWPSAARKLRCLKEFFEFRFSRRSWACIPYPSVVRVAEKGDFGVSWTVVHRRQIQASRNTFLVDLSQGIWGKNVCVIIEAWSCLHRGAQSGSIWRTLRELWNLVFITSE